MSGCDGHSAKQPGVGVGPPGSGGKNPPRPGEGRPARPRGDRRQADATAKTATELGGKVLVPPFDAPWVRMTVLADPQGATFIASKFVLEKQGPRQPAERSRRGRLRESVGAATESMSLSGSIACVPWCRQLVRRYRESHQTQAAARSPGWRVGSGRARGSRSRSLAESSFRARSSAGACRSSVPGGGEADQSRRVGVVGREPRLAPISSTSARALGEDDEGDVAEDCARIAAVAEPAVPVSPRRREAQGGGYDALRRAFRRSSARRTWPEPTHLRGLTSSSL
jgi:hypothetical protein